MIDKICQNSSYNIKLKLNGIFIFIFIKFQKIFLKLSNLKADQRKRECKCGKEEEIVREREKKR